MRRVIISRICLALIFCVLLSGLYWRTRGIGRVQAAPKADPNILWSIGVVDNAGDEFGLGAEPSLIYQVSAKATPRQWRERQDSNGSVYKIAFSLDQVPPDPPVFIVNGFFMMSGRAALS